MKNFRNFVSAALALTLTLSLAGLRQPGNHFRRLR